MDIFEIAKKREKMMADLYGQLAEATFDPKIRKVFLVLKDEETKHYNAVEESKFRHQSETTSHEIPIDVKVLWDEVKRFKDLAYPNQSQISLYEKARDSEWESFKFYEGLAEKTSDLGMKDILNDFAAEEHRHFVLMENIVEFLSRPTQWIENAEIGHIRESY